MSKNKNHLVTMSVYSKIAFGTGVKKTVVIFTVKFSAI